MQIQFKNLNPHIMHKQLILLFLAIGFLTANGQESGKNFIDQNYIKVIGSAEKKVTPDRVYMKILINEKDLRRQTVEEVEKIMIEKLEELHIDVAKQLVVKDLVSNFRYHWLLQSNTLTAKEYELLVYDAKTAGKVFTELGQIGVSNISIDRLEHSHIENLRQEVKIEAVKSAKENAEAFANALGQRIGKAILIYESKENFNLARSIAGRTPGIRIRGVSSAIYGSRAPEPDLDFEKIKIEYEITVKFELE